MAEVEGSVGILLRSHGSSLIVAALTPAGPAADSGEVRVDDEITAVENVPVHCEPHSETIARLRGTVGSQVTVALRRHDAASGKLLSTLITLTRAEPEISLEKRAASSQRQTPQARFTQLQDDIRRLDRAGVHSQHSMQKGKAVWTPVDQNGIKTEMVTFEAARFATTREQDRFQSLPPAPDDLVPAQPQLTAQSPAPASALSWEPTIEAPTGPAQRRRTPDHSVLTDAGADQERNASSSNAMDSFLIPHRGSLSPATDSPSLSRPAEGDVRAHGLLFATQAQPALAEPLQARNVIRELSRIRRTACAITRFRAGSSLLRRLVAAWRRAVAQAAEHLRRDRWLRRVASRLDQRASQRCLVLMWVKWLSEVKQRRVINRVVLRWWHKALCSAWSTWHTQVQDGVRQRALGNRVCQRWRSQVIAEAWNTWSERYAKHSRVLEHASRVVVRLSKLGMARSLDAWRWQTSERRRLVRAADWVMRRWLRHRTAAAFGSWVWRRHQAKRMHTCGRRVLARLRKRALCVALERWHSHTLLYADQRTLLTRAIMRVINVVYAHAFDSWREQAAAARRWRRAGKTILLRLRYMALAPAWTRWCEYCKEKSRMKRAGRKVALRWRHAAEARGLARWRERIARDKKWQQASRQIVLRWQRGLLAPALCRWSDGCKGQKRLRRAAGKVVVRWRQLALAPAFCRLAVFSQQRSRMRRSAQAVLQKWRNAAISRAWGSWHAEHVKAKRHTRMACQTLVRWRGRARGVVMARWLQHLEETKRIRRAAHTVSCRSKASAVYPAFSAWCRFASERRRLGVLGARLRRRLQHARVAAAVLAWGARARRLRRLDGASRAVMRWTRTADLTPALEAWCRHARACRARRHRIARVVVPRFALARTQTSARCLDAWQMLVQDSARQRQLISSAREVAATMCRQARALYRWCRATRTHMREDLRQMRDMLEWLEKEVKARGHALEAAHESAGSQTRAGTDPPPETLLATPGGQLVLAPDAELGAEQPADDWRGVFVGRGVGAVRVDPHVVPHVVDVSHDSPPRVSLAGASEPILSTDLPSFG